MDIVLVRSNGGYVHELALMPRELVMPSSEGGGGRRLVPL